MHSVTFFDENWSTLVEDCAKTTEQISLGFDLFYSKKHSKARVCRDILDLGHLMAITGN